MGGETNTFFNTLSFNICLCLSLFLPIFFIFCGKQGWSEKEKVLVTQLCLNLCDPMDCSSPNSFVHGILQARILEWVAIPFSRGSSRPRDWSQVSCTAGRFFIIWATREVPKMDQMYKTCQKCKHKSHTLFKQCHLRVKSELSGKGHFLKH